MTVENCSLIGNRWQIREVRERRTAGNLRGKSWKQESTTGMVRPSIWVKTLPKSWLMWLRWLEHCSVHRTMAGLIPCQGMRGRQPISVSLSFPPPSCPWNQFKTKTLPKSLVDCCIINQGPADNQPIGYTYMRRFIIEIGSCDYGSWEVPRSAVCKLEKQESWWCNSVWVQRPEN